MARIPYRIPPRKVVASAALVALLGASGAALTLDTVEEWEGYVPYGYKDPVGIPTRCWGDTRNVELGREYSFEECSRSINEHLYEIARPVSKCIAGFDGLPEETRAAVVSMAYNIGNGAMCRSSVVRYLNLGMEERACRRMAEIYKTAKGKELPGLVRRRKAESRMCLEGLRKAGRM